MGKKFKPTIKAQEKKLDALVEQGIEANATRSSIPEEIVRKPNGYTLRTDYIKKVSLLAATLDMKKYEVIEKALEMFFEANSEHLK